MNQQPKGCRTFGGERPLTLRQVPDHLPRRQGKKVHYSTVYRWSTNGVRGRVLETSLVGGIRYTTLEAVQRFLATQPVFDNSEQLDAINRALDDAGI